jgi:hypothetical protein
LFLEQEKGKLKKKSSICNVEARNNKKALLFCTTISIIKTDGMKNYLKTAFYEFSMTLYISYAVLCGNIPPTP